MQFTSFPIGQYACGLSFLHRLDPRTKIIFVLVYAVMLFAANTGLLLAVYGAVAFSALRFSRFSMLYFWQGLKGTFLFIVLFGFIQFISVHTGKLIWALGWIEIYDGGAKNAVFITCRLILLILMASLLTLTTPPNLLAYALETLLRPFRRFGFPGQEFALMMTIAVRFIPAFLQEIGIITKALRARGADFESRNIIKRFHNLLHVFAILIMSAFRRSNKLALAMESRCYREGKARTNRKILQAGPPDAMIGVVALLLVIITLFFRNWD